MSEADGKNERAIATAARELFLLGRKTVAARAVLAAVHKELNQANSCRQDPGRARRNHFRFLSGARDSERGA